MRNSIDKAGDTHAGESRVPFVCSFSRLFDVPKSWQQAGMSWPTCSRVGAGSRGVEGYSVGGSGGGPGAIAKVEIRQERIISGRYGG